MKEVLLNDELNFIAQQVKEWNKHNKDGDQQSKQMQEWLIHLQLKIPHLFNKLLDQQVDPIRFSFALDSRMEGREFVIGDCKVMNSKKLPLWLVVKSNCETYDDTVLMHHKST